MAKFDDLQKLEREEKKLKDMVETNPGLYTDRQRERQLAVVDAVRSICGVVEEPKKKPCKGCSGKKK